jgi:hypothetical protein
MYLVAVPPEARPAGRTLADVLVPEGEDECRNDGRRAYASCSPGTLRPLPLGGSAWREITGSIPRDSGCVTCTPADSNDCNPSRKPA